MDGITLYQSVLTAVGSFRVLMGGFTETVGITAYQSVITAVGSFRLVSEMDGITLYQSVLTAVGSFQFLRWMASLRRMPSLSIIVS